jgi:hypothetical protein
MTDDVSKRWHEQEARDAVRAVETILAPTRSTTRARSRAARDKALLRVAIQHAILDCVEAADAEARARELAETGALYDGRPPMWADLREIARDLREQGVVQWYAGVGPEWVARMRRQRPGDWQYLQLLRADAAVWEVARGMVAANLIYIIGGTIRGRTALVLAGPRPPFPTPV